MLADPLSMWLWPKLTDRQGRVRTVQRARTLFEEARLQPDRRRTLYRIVRALAARKLPLRRFDGAPRSGAERWLIARYVQAFWINHEQSAGAARFT